MLSRRLECRIVKVLCVIGVRSQATPIMAVVSAMRFMTDFLTIFIVFSILTEKSLVAKTFFLLGSIDWEGRLYFVFLAEAVLCVLIANELSITSFAR